MRNFVLALASAVFLAPLAQAQTAEEIVAKYVKAIGGMERIQAVESLRRTGWVIRGGGVETAVVRESRRPNLVREETTRLGLTGVRAWDGKTAWKLEPWRGRRDVEPLSEEETQAILEDADFDGPLIDYARKGLRLELIGRGQVEGTDVFKLRVTSREGTVFTYSLDAEYFVPIEIDTRRIVRGAEREYELLLGDYKPVAGWYLPFSYELRPKGGASGQQTEYDRIEANVPLPAERFAEPGPAGAARPGS